jgi:hypothetical protein
MEKTANPYDADWKMWFMGHGGGQPGEAVLERGGVDGAADGVA